MNNIYYSQKEFDEIWNKLEFLGSASEGTCKRLNKKEVIKYLDGPYFDLKEEKILQFKDTKLKTYLFPYKIFYIDNIMMGYITKYSSGKNLIKVPRDNIKFDKVINGSKLVEEDTKKLSKNGIEVCDILFNILYKNGIFHIIDTCDYEQTDKDYDILYRENISSFNYSLLEYLIKDRFYKFVFSSKELREYYKEVENGESIIPFLELLKQKLSEFCDKDIIMIKDAKKAITLCHKSVYPEYF